MTNLKQSIHEEQRMGQDAAKNLFRCEIFDQLYILYYQIEQMFRTRITRDSLNYQYSYRVPNILTPIFRNFDLRAVKVLYN